MIAQRPPMGWNTWNTFADDINDKLIRETADAMVELGYRDAGYEYVVIDDCWLLRDRDYKTGRLVPDPEKFPHGMKAVADYVHSKGLKFGIYSCAGVRTCAGYASSFDHEYEDARTFAEWGVDFLKYDFCNFPNYADNRNRYLTMSMALRSTGREIVFSACNWGRGEPWNWMRSIGAHMYRSTPDIIDTYESFASIITSQIPYMNANAAGCFNDLDMLTVGMHGKGNVGRENCTKPEEYVTQFVFWCLASSPLMIGSDIRSLDGESRKLLQNRELIRLNQDAECRPAYQANGTTKDYPIFIRMLENGEFALVFFNFKDAAHTLEIPFPDIGVPYSSGVAVSLFDMLTGEDMGLRRDDMRLVVPAHGCRAFRAKLVKV
jgi:alpha-galactosidase